MNSSWVLISGSSTGIGRATATHLSAQGFNIIAGVRSEKDGHSLLKAATGGRIVPVLLDVTSQSQIADAVVQARELAGSSGLRAVINNAGIVVAGPAEHVSAADWRRQFDVNFFGMIELTRATLPLLRLAAAFHGQHVPRLLFVSSIGGRVSQPLLTPYTTSKFATTALGDGLRLELRRQGIGVTVIEPGAVATAIWAKGDTAAEEFSPNHPARRLYHSEINGLTAAAKRTAKKAISAEQAAIIIFRSLTARRAPARVLVGQDAKVIAFLKHWLPVSWFDAILAREFGITSQPLSNQELSVQSG
jgi:NAD(P)-dependent dehydrogenase (short-subunit alcohol dehydrogenase family)